MTDKPGDVVQGTLDMLILKTVALEPIHGYGIAVRIEQMSKGVFRVNAGSLFVAMTNFFHYTGREFDTETNLYYYRARYYDPASGRFLSEDPLRFRANRDNFYEYAFDDPLDYSDPSGEQVPVPVPVPEPWPVPGSPFWEPPDQVPLPPGYTPPNFTNPGPPPSPSPPAPPTGWGLSQAYGWWDEYLKSGNMQQLKNPDRATCKDNCPPCDPPVGTLRYRLDIVPPSSTHKRWPGTHWHVEQMQQRNDCKCDWKEIANGQGPPPPFRRCRER